MAWMDICNDPDTADVPAQSNSFLNWPSSLISCSRLCMQP